MIRKFIGGGRAPTVCQLKWWTCLSSLFNVHTHVRHSHAMTCSLVTNSEKYSIQTLIWYYWHSFGQAFIKVDKVKKKWQMPKLKEFPPTPAGLWNVMLQRRIMRCSFHRPYCGLFKIHISLQQNLIRQQKNDPDINFGVHNTKRKLNSTSSVWPSALKRI